MTMQIKLDISINITPDRAGTYFNHPFQMPADVAALALTYRYDRRPATESAAGKGTFLACPEANIIDLGLIGPDGRQVGASGSDKTEITLSETYATPGYTPCPLVPGEWGILVGAYKVAPQGVTVIYELTFTFKERSLYKGDLHTHTLASDGVHSVAELAIKAARNGLDFLAITDHNQFATAATFPPPAPDSPTLIPGVEWTHYRGHANFLGVERPYDAPFAANTPAEVRERFVSAHERGALIVANHPCDESCPFTFDLADLPIDCLEIWNGPMREANLRAVGLWHSRLAAGEKIPMCGGSDYHRDTPFIFLGGPTTCVYALSNGPSDLLDALRHGHAYVTFAPNGPGLELTAGRQAILGDSVPWPQVRELQLEAWDLLAGDVVRVITAQASETLVEAPAPGRFSAVYPMDAPGFARVEILRRFLPGLPPLPALISNPIYFDAA